MTVIEETTKSELVFDAGLLARGWLAVSLACGQDDARPTLYRTVAIELFDAGARLVATDSYVLLSAWVPCNLDALDPPGLDEVPNETIVAIDVDGRGRNLLAFALALATAKDAPPIDVHLSVGALDPDELTFDGMDGRALILALESSSGHEELRLRLFEGAWVDWRTVLAKFTPETTDTVALNPEIVGRLAKLAKLHPGALAWKFGGSDRMALVELADPTPPRISGAVMPIKLSFIDLEPPAEPDPTPAPPAAPRRRRASTSTTGETPAEELARSERETAERLAAEADQAQAEADEVRHFEGGADDEITHQLEDRMAEGEEPPV